MQDKNSRSFIFIKNTFWVYFSKILSQLVGIVALVLVIKELPVHLYGTFTFLLSGIIIFNIIAVSPIINVFNRYIPELFQNKEYRKIGKLILYGTILSGIVVFLLIVILQIYINEISHFFNLKNLDRYIIPFLFFVISRFTQIIINSVITSLLLQKQTSIIKILNSLLKSAFYIGLLPIMSVNILLYVEIGISVVFTIAGLVIFLQFYSKLNFNEERIEEYVPVTRKRIIKFGLFSSFNELGAGVIGRTSDIYIISAMSSPFVLGLYSFATRIYDMLLRLIPIEELTTVLRPLFIQKFTKKYSNKEFNQMYNFIVKVMLLVFLIPTLYFINFGLPIIRLIFDDKYVGAYIVTCITLGGNIITALFFPLGIVTQLKEKVNIAFYSKIIIVFSIIVGIYAMKHWGIEGVAVVTLIGELMKNIFIYIFIRRKIHLNYSFKEYRRFILIILILTLPVLATNYISDIWQLILTSILFFFLTIPVIIWLHPFNKEGLAQIYRLSKLTRDFLKIRKYLPDQLRINKSASN